MASSERRLTALGRKIRQGASFGLRTWIDLFHATIELAIARARLRSTHARNLLGQTSGPTDRPSPAMLNAKLEKLVGRVAFAIPRAGQRLPWRADCFVQALAAQRWLGRHGVDSQLLFGVRKPAPVPFEAHAWLKVGERVVTGGDISGYVPLREDQT